MELRGEDGERGFVGGGIPAGRTGRELTIWVSRREAKTELRGGGPPFTEAFLKPDISLHRH